MKPQLTETKKRPSVPKPAGAEAALSLQEELVAAIQGAFEVAVEIAVQEVTKLVGQATGDHYEAMRRENESLKQRLQRAETMLDSVRMEVRGGGSPPPHARQLLDATNRTGQATAHTKCSPKSSDRNVGNVHGSTGVRGDTPPADQPPDPQHKHRNQEQRPGDEVKTQHVSDAASEPKRNNGCADCDALTIGMCSSFYSLDHCPNIIYNTFGSAVRYNQQLPIFHTFCRVGLASCYVMC